MKIGLKKEAKTLGIELMDYSVIMELVMKSILKKTNEKNNKDKNIKSKKI